MIDDEQRERNRAKLEHLRQKGFFRDFTPADTHMFGEPVALNPPPDRTRLGVPLAEAVWRFARHQPVGRRFLDLAWRTRIKSDSPDLLTSEELEEYYNLRDGLCAELVKRLAAGEIEAIRLLDGGTREAVVLVTWWFSACLDSERDAATSQGEMVYGLLFRLPSKAIESTAPLPQVQAGSRPTPDEWMAQNVSRARQWKRDDALAECAKATGGTHRLCLAAWNSLHADVKGTRGRHKG